MRLILYDFVKIPQSFFVPKNDSSLYKGAFVRQGRALSLRYDIEFNLILAESSFVFVNFHGGSKPPPYTVGYIIHSIRSANFCGLQTAVHSASLVKGAGLLWRPLHLMQKHRPNRQVRRWVAVGNSEGL